MALTQSTKDFLKGIIAQVVIAILILSATFYLIFGFEHPEKKKLKNENWCSEIIFFNIKTKKLDTIYSNAVMLDDSLVSFRTPDGKIWKSKDFINNEETNENNNYTNDITMSTKEHFRVTVLSEGPCKSKKEMENIKNTDPMQDGEN